MIGLPGSDSGDCGEKRSPHVRALAHTGLRLVGVPPGSGRRQKALGQEPRRAVSFSNVPLLRRDLLLSTSVALDVVPPLTLTAAYIPGMATYPFPPWNFPESR